jgi:uncharacterized integral membrane protein
MAILGLLLVAAAAVIGVEFAVSNTATTGFEIFGNPYVASLGTIALLGAAVGAVALLGLWLVVSSLRRRRTRRTIGKHRAQVEELQSRAAGLEAANQDLIEDNDRLRAELAAHELAQATMGGVAVPPGTGQVPYGDQVSDSVHKDMVDVTDGTLAEPYPAGRTHDRTAEGEEKAGVLGRFRGTS